MEVKECTGKGEGGEGCGASKVVRERATKVRCLRLNNWGCVGNEFRLGLWLSFIYYTDCIK